MTATDTIKSKIKKFCAYQERCHKEVRERLKEYGCYGDLAEGIISELIEQNFLNEERYAAAYVRGKHLHKKWGRLKIERELIARQISSYCIKKGMLEIETETYYRTLVLLAEKYLEKWGHLSVFERNSKTYRYLSQKGYEASLIWEVLKELET